MFIRGRKKPKVIHYHGCPITPETAAAKILAGRHCMVSFAHPEQVELAFECCSSVALDNGAFPVWKSGRISDWPNYYRWVDRWRKHPAFDFALIPDVIDGTEIDNDALLGAWNSAMGRIDEYRTIGCPVWHLHESLDRLKRLMWWPRVALGSSGEYAEIGTVRWFDRMVEAMDVLCPNGYPLVRIHGLRMLDTAVFTKFPFASADSTNAARNIGLDGRWSGPYQPASKAGRGVVIADRIEAFQSAAAWVKPATQARMFGW